MAPAPAAYIVQREPQDYRPVRRRRTRGLLLASMVSMLLLLLLLEGGLTGRIELGGVLYSGYIDMQRAEYHRTRPIYIGGLGGARNMHEDVYIEWWPFKVERSRVIEA